MSTSKFNSEIHDRKSIRLTNYDYSQEGMYFITICPHNKEHRFGSIEDKEMILNEYGVIAKDAWIKLTEGFAIELDVYTVMPNHFHGIIIITDKNKQKTLGNMIGAYKSSVFNEMLKLFKKRDEGMGMLWQRNFYDHIIRNQESYFSIANYILNNPANWEGDEFYK